MASTWDPTPLLGASSHRGNQSVRQSLWSWEHAGGLVRLGVHIAIGALFVAVAWGLVPEQFDTPDIRRLLASPPARAENIPVEAPALPQSEKHFLQSASVPVTSRVIRSSLPIGEPQHAVRTSVTIYTVQPGDSVLGIAQKFGLEGNTVLWSNDRLADNPDFLKVGQELNILPLDGAYHTVIKGETLDEIARAHKVDATVITEYPGNDMTAPYQLEAGQKLIIPGGIRPYIPRRVFAYQGPIPENAKKGSGSFVWPTSGYITQGYWEGHHATDIGAPQGTPIVAADSGYVAVAQWSDVGYGRVVIIDHGNGFQTLYAHMLKYFVESGQSVSKGQQIGQCGSTGNSTGSHLHFEVINKSVRRNPFIYLP